MGDTWVLLQSKREVSVCKNKGENSTGGCPRFVSEKEKVFICNNKG